MVLTQFRHEGDLYTFTHDFSDDSRSLLKGTEEVFRINSNCSVHAAGVCLGRICGNDTYIFKDNTDKMVFDSKIWLNDWKNLEKADYIDGGE